MQTPGQAISSALTEMSEQPTKETRVNTQDWAKWLNLETFGDRELEALVEKCAKFARGIVNKDKPFWLSLLGKSGTGKSHCASRLWDLHNRMNWSHSHYIGHIVYWPAFVEQLRELVREGLGTSKILDMGKWPMLILDDIGAERDSTGFAAEKLNLLLGMRVGKWTVLTSNLTLDGLGAIDDRIASRIIRERGNLYIEMTTKDYGLR